MKEHLKFTRVDDYRDTWLVENDEGDWIGTIMKSDVFKKRFVLKEIEYYAEFTSESLRQVGNLIESLENKH